MTGAEDTIIAEAAAWHAASEHDEMDWDGFTHWLEADPRHRAAYDEVALADTRLRELAPGMTREPFPANDVGENGIDGAAPVSHGRSGWRRWAGAALAASLVAILAIPQFLAGDPQVFETEAASRTVALADGSQVMLAPHSRLMVEDGEQQLALNGGAWFDIRHDPSRRMTIQADGLRIRDIGTQFDVQAAAGKVRVAVGEGTINVSGQALATPVTLPAGRGLVFDPAGGTALVKAVRAEDVGGWRSGRLSYESASLALVAADLSRYSDMKVVVAEPLADRKFSGTLIVKDGKAALRDLSQLMGVDVAAGGGAYRLVPAKR